MGRRDGESRRPRASPRREALHASQASRRELIGAALTTETAEWMGGWADGLITAGADSSALQQVIEAFRAGGGDEKPVMLQSAVCYAPTKEQALAAAHDQWRHALLTRRWCSTSTCRPNSIRPANSTTPERWSKDLRISADINQFVDWLSRDADLGFDAIYIHHVGRDIERFIDDFSAHVFSSFI